jgi:hypothetical protein
MYLLQSKKRPEGCCQTLNPLEINLRDGACVLFPIKSNVSATIDL